MNTNVTYSESDKQPVMVTIRCMTFNHAFCIRQCLDGFVMQKTNFRFEAIIHDDASTDGTASVIREYEKKYPDIIKPIYQVENQYSKHDGSIRRALDSKTRGKYIALCEGDDYWIDPLKLQKQVDFLEANPDFSMVCNRTKMFSERKKEYIGDIYCYKQNHKVPVRDVIYRGGLYISTCSILIRKSLFNTFPDYVLNCRVGDYPLQIYAAMHGCIYYINKAMSSYRVDNTHSWMGEQKMCTASPERIAVVQSQVKMLEGFANDYPEYSKLFERKISQFINSNLPNWRCSPKEVAYYLNIFKPQIDKYSIWWKLDLFIMKIRLPLIRRVYKKIFQSRFSTLYTHNFSL